MTNFDQIFIKTGVNPLDKRDMPLYVFIVRIFHLIILSDQFSTKFSQFLSEEIVPKHPVTFSTILTKLAIK